MSKKKKVIVAVGLMGSALIIADVCWSIYQTEIARFSNKPNRSYPSNTLAESMARGTFLAKLTVESHSFEWDGQHISINDIWLERKAERTGTFVIIPLLLEWPTYKTLEGYDICFNLAQGRDLFFQLNGPFFVQEGREASSAQAGTLAWGTVPNPDFKELSVLVTNDWKFSKSVRLKILNPKAK